MMVPHNQEKHKTAYTVTCDAAVGEPGRTSPPAKGQSSSGARTDLVTIPAGVTTGISAHDRALTARTLADSSKGAKDFTRPGHLVPLRAVEGGVLARRGHTESSVGEFRHSSWLSVISGPDREHPQRAGRQC